MDVFVVLYVKIKLRVQVRELATEGKFDYLLIESTGIS